MPFDFILCSSQSLHWARHQWCDQWNRGMQRDTLVFEGSALPLPKFLGERELMFRLVLRVIGRLSRIINCTSALLVHLIQRELSSQGRLLVAFGILWKTVSVPTRTQVFLSLIDLFCNSCAEQTPMVSVHHRRFFLNQRSNRNV